MWKLALLVHMMAWGVLFGCGAVAILSFPELTETFGPELIFPWAGISFLAAFPIAWLVARRMVMWRRSPVTGRTRPREPLP